MKMNENKVFLEQYYETMGIAEPVYRFCSKIEENLKKRFPD